MSPALTSRNPQSPAPAASRTPAATTTENAARLPEAKNETATQPDFPLRSQYIWSESSESGGSSSTRTGIAAGDSDTASRMAQHRYSTFEAYAANCEEVLDSSSSGAAWSSPPSAAASNSSNRSSAKDHGRRVSTSNFSDASGRNNTNRSGSSNSISGSATSNSSGGSALQPGGRTNFFFGANYSGSNKHLAAERASAEATAAAAAMAAIPGVARSAVSESPPKMQKFPGASRSGGREVGVSATLEGNNLKQDPKLTSCAGSTTPPRKEPPPGLTPLGEEDEEEEDSGMTAGRAGVDVRVAFPPDFDSSRKNTSDSDDGGKMRGAGSLGTKSGSTSLLSMLSASPRSLGTAHNSADGLLSPQTPLSGGSCSDGAATGSARPRDGASGGSNSGGGSGRRSDVSETTNIVNTNSSIARNGDLAHEPWSSSEADADKPTQSEETGIAALNAEDKSGRSATVTRRHLPEDLPAVTVAVEALLQGDDDDNDVPSAHPTPLSTFGGDAELPSDHPTPLSSHGLMSRSSSCRGTVSGNSNGGSSANDPLSSSSKLKADGKSVKATSSSFMQRLKYWGGAGSGSGGKKEPKPVAKEVVSPTMPSTTSSRERRSSSRTTTTVSEASALVATAVTAATIVPPVTSSRGHHSSSRTTTVSESSVFVATAVTVAEKTGYVGRHGRMKAGPSASPSKKSVPAPAASSSSSSSRQHRGTTAADPSSGEGGLRELSAVDSSPLPSSPPAYSSSLKAISTQQRQPSQKLHTKALEVELEGVRALPPAYGTGQSFSSPTIPAAPNSAVGLAMRKFGAFGAGHRTDLASMRRARDENKEEEKDGDKGEESEEESQMDWGAASDVEAVGDDAKEKENKRAALTVAERIASIASTEKAVPGPPFSATAGRFRGGSEPPAMVSTEQQKRQQQQQQKMEVVRPPSPPPYMAIVEAANVTSALDTSSTSEQDTSPSEDDGGMMAEILTDRLMEVCDKMEAVADPPADTLSDGDGPTAFGEGAGNSNGTKWRNNAARRARNMSNASGRMLQKEQSIGSSRRQFGHQSSFFSTSGLGLTDGDAGEAKGEEEDSDEETVRDEGAAARKLRRDRLRKRSRAQSRRALSSALNVPTDSSGETISIHSSAYNGHPELLNAYIMQGGDLEVRDQFQATALMLCSEQGHTQMVDSLLAAGADTCAIDENGNSALHLACFYSNADIVELLLSVDVDVTAADSEGRTPLDLATDPIIRRMVRTEEVVRMSGHAFDLLGAVEVNDTSAVTSFITMGQEACGYPHNSRAVPIAAERLRLNRAGRGGMTAVHLAAFHGYSDNLRLLLEAGADPNAICDDGETPLHTACTGGSILCATLLLDHGANPLATDAKGLVPCEKHNAGGRLDMKRLLEAKAFQATPANLMALREDLAEVALQIDAEEDLFVRKGVAIKYLRKALKKKEADMSRLRQAVEARDADIRNLGDRMNSVHRLLIGISVS